MTAGVLTAGAVLVLAAAFGFARRRYVAVTVTGPSMEPTLRSGDLVFVRRAGLRSVRPGQVVVFRRPPPFRTDDGEPPRWTRFGVPVPDRPNWTIKRVAAVPGETLPDELASLGPVVPAGRLAVLGDNRGRSADSRGFGYVSESELLGVVIRPRLGPYTGSVPQLR